MVEGEATEMQLYPVWLSYLEHGQTYRKSSPKVVLNEPYYKELQKRIADEPSQMTTLRYFFNLCKNIRANIITS